MAKPKPARQVSWALYISGESSDFRASAVAFQSTSMGQLGLSALGRFLWSGSGGIGFSTGLASLLVSLLRPWPVGRHCFQSLDRTDRQKKKIIKQEDWLLNELFLRIFRFSKNFLSLSNILPKVLLVSNGGNRLSLSSCYPTRTSLFWLLLRFFPFLFGF